MVARGTILTSHREKDMLDLQCMSFVSIDNGVLLVAGRQDVMYKIDVEKGQVLQRVRAFPPCFSVAC